MFEGIRNYVYRRRRGIFTTIAVGGGLYLAGKYVLDKLRELRDQAIKDMNARENYRRHFEQNLRDATYTIMALLPTLSGRVLKEMDVEGLTKELQAMSKTKRVSIASTETGERTSDESSSLASSMNLSANSNPGPANEDPNPAPISAQQQATADNTHERQATMASSTLSGMSSFVTTEGQDQQSSSWVQEFTSMQSSSGARSGSEAPESLSASVASSFRDPAMSLLMPSQAPIPGPSASSSAPTPDGPLEASAASVSGVESISVSSQAGYFLESIQSGSLPEHNKEHIPSTSTARSSGKSKMELWQEIKILTFTRVLTILYSTALLTLLTHVQLSLIARHRYISSVTRQEYEELERQREERSRASRNVWLSSWLNTDFALGDELDEELDSQVRVLPPITEETERKFLTMTLWLLKVGWKDVSERVRRSVEEVFEDVSLKSKIGPLELHRLLCDVRRRVEHEITYEGKERKITFLSTLIPPTRETLHHVLIEGGIPASDLFVSASSSHFQPATTSMGSIPIDDTQFESLLAQTQEVLSEDAFSSALECCMDEAVRYSLSGLGKGVWNVDNGADGATLKGVDEDKKTRLAALLPDLSRYSREVLQGMPNELVDRLASLPETVSLSNWIFGGFEDINLR